MIILMMPDLSLDLHSLQSSTRIQSIHIIPDKGSFIEKGFGGTDWDRGLRPCIP